MNRARKFFRGSGRVLGFIFAASVIWLLFDMAALKLSFSDTNSKLLKEQLMRGERGSFKEWKQQVLQERLITGPMFRRGDRPPSLVDSNPDRFKDRIRNRFQRKKQLPLPLGNVEHNFNKPVLPEQATGTFLEPNAPPALDAQINDKRDVPGRAVNSSELQSERWAHGPSQIPLVTHSKAPVNLTAAHTSAAQRKHPAQNVDQPVNADQRREAGNGKGISLSPSPQAPEVNRTQKTPSNSSGLPTKQPAYQAAEPADPEMGDVMLVHKILPNETNAGRQVAKPIADLDAAQLGKNNANTTVKLQNIDGIKLAVNASITKTYVGQAIERLSNVTQKPNTQFLNRLKSKHTSNKLDDTHNANTTTHKVNSSNVYAHVVIKGADLGTGNATESKPPNIINQQEVGNVLTVLEKKDGLHKVLTIDITVSPRNHHAIGQYGRAAEVPKGKEEESERRWKEGYFNAYLSDLIPIDRAIVDTRPHGCSEKLVHDHLPSTSIIMCFVDELWSTLLRSVMSVLNRSPAHLIKQIILVDDFSTKEHLKEKLDKYMLQFPKVRILHLKKRYGLIRARLAGASIATGDVLTFLDSHVECNVGWLEPLLESVYLNRKKVACPVIEVISDKDMSYMTVDNFQRGIFSWPLNFGWKPIPPEEIKKNNIKESDPIRCPVMAGGLFSIDKNYFYELGTYDPGLEVWGGENMELSFKVWMCGGEIEINPCSRVGHIFRNDNPYSFPKDRLKTVEKNLARVAEVWMDEYKELFYGHGYHVNMQKFEIGDLTQQKALRKSLQCKSFKWYLENVFPDLDAPVVMASGLVQTDKVSTLVLVDPLFPFQLVLLAKGGTGKSNFHHFLRTPRRSNSHTGTISRDGMLLCSMPPVLKNMGLDKCLGIKNTTVFFDTCSSTNENQQFNYTWLRLIKQGDVCLASINGGGKIALHHCDDMNNNMKWLHKSLVTFQPLLKDHIVLEPVHSPVCLEVDRVHKVLRTNPCDPLNHFQKWTFGKYLVEG